MIYHNGKQNGFIEHNGNNIDKIMHNGECVFTQGFDTDASGLGSVTLEGTIGKDLTNYVISGNGPFQADTPSPDNIVEIQGVGDKTENLLDFTAYNTPLTFRGLTFYCKGGEIYFDGAASSDVTGTTFTTKVTITETATLSFDYDSEIISGFFVRYTDDYPNDIKSINKGTTKTLSPGSYDVYFRVPANYVFDNLKIKLMLNSGSESLSYEPFGIKIPVVSMGKNLLNILRDVESAETYGVKAIYRTNNTIKVSGTVQRTSNYGVGAVRLSENTLDLNLKVGEIYTLSITGRRSNNFYVQINGKDNSGTNFALTNLLNGANKRTFTVPDIFDRVEGLFVGIYGSAYGETIDEEITVQLEKGADVSSFDTYHEPKITNIYLSSPLMSGESLTAISRDVKWGVVDLGNLNWRLLNEKFWADNLPHKIYPNNVIPPALCTVYVVRTTNDVVGKKSGIALGTAGAWGEKCIGVYDNNYSTAEEFKESVKGIKFYYELATPTTESLTPTSIPTFKNAEKTIKGTTTTIDINTQLKPIFTTSYKSNIGGFDVVNFTTSDNNIFTTADDNTYSFRVKRT